MKEVCLQCHGQTWVDDHYVKLDKVVQEYNEVYFKPAKAMLDELYAKGCWTTPSSSTRSWRWSITSCGTTRAAGPAWARP